MQENVPNLFKSRANRSLEETPPLTTPESTEDDLNSPEEEKETCFPQKQQLQISNSSVLNAFSKQNDKLRFKRKHRNLIQGKRKKKARRKRSGAGKSGAKSPLSAASSPAELMGDESMMENNSSDQSSVADDPLGDHVDPASGCVHSSVAERENLVK